MLTEIKGDLIKFTEAQYIAHQCNCLTINSAGMAESIFNAFPWSNIYAERSIDIDYKKLPEGNRPGDIVIRGNGTDQRYVINMIAQLFPGRPRYPDSTQDGTRARQTFFQICLNKIARIDGLRSIAFPYRIGCNLAGGDWTIYRNMLVELDLVLKDKVEVYIVRKD